MTNEKNVPNFLHLLLSLYLIILGGSGCASKGGILDSIWGNKSKSSNLNSNDKNGSGPNELDPLGDNSGYVKYSDNPQMAVPANRQYRHMTRQRLEEESDLHPQAGSMWISEGQGAYLFAQNKMRREGDLLNVKLDGPAMRQVETKVNVIKKLLKQLEEETGTPPPVSPPSLAKEGSETEGRSPASTSDASKAGEGQSAKGKKDDKSDLSEVQNVQTRIVEKLPDGNYRIKGQQPFMIDKKEYKVIVAGFIRPEDFTDDGVASSKLIDPQIDVISVRRNPKNEY